MSERIEQLKWLVERCEAGREGDQFDLIVETGQALDIGPRMNAWVDLDAYMSAAIDLLPKGASWRKYTDDTCSVYAASPYNAKAQVRYDGLNKVTPLALCAALLRMHLAPLLKEAARQPKPTPIRTDEGGGNG
jgi:hypothetical protein